MKNGLIDTYIFLRELFEGIEGVTFEAKIEAVRGFRTPANVFETILFKEFDKTCVRLLERLCTLGTKYCQHNFSVM